MNRNLLILLFLFAGMLRAGAQNVICDYCGKPVIGKNYISAEGKFFHNEHFLCADCGKPITKEYFIKGNNFYHTKCYKKNFGQVCNYCSEPITGKYFMLDGKPYHQKCYEEHAAKRCALCGDVINGRYIADYWGNYYHSEHSGVQPQCDYCARFISDKLTKGGTKYSDGRVICSLCYNRAVLNQNKAVDLMNRIIDRLYSKGIKIPNENLELHLVDRNELGKRSSGRFVEPDMRGFANYEYTILDGKIVNRKFDVYILRGLPNEVFSAVAAHELMHVWIYTFGKNKPQGRLVEGSCNFASYLILNDSKGEDAEHILDQISKNTDPIYGGGFRSIKKYAETYGIQMWLDYLKNNTALPNGY